VVTANHPFGFLDAAILAAVLCRVRPDFKIVANSLLSSVPELRAGFIFVNPNGGGASIRENRRPMRECLDWLERGSMLALFPSGDVARLNWRDGGIVDPPWNSCGGASHPSRRVPRVAALLQELQRPGVLVGYLETQKESDLARLIKPRRPYRQRWARPGTRKRQAASRRTWRNSPRPSPTWSATARACRS
jgi:putative hemolysin